jgi:hypothetical protein
MSLTRPPSFTALLLLKGSTLGKVLRTALAAVAVVCIPSMAWSAAILGSAANVTGISDLVVAGVTYDIAFSTDSYATTFASQTPTFLNDNAGATAATQAIASLFLAEGVTGIDGTNCNVKPGGVADYFWCTVIVPNQVVGASFSAAFANRLIYPNGGIQDWYGVPASSMGLSLNQSLGFLIGPPNFQSGSGGYFVSAVFTPDVTAVPEPATLTLIGLGLVGAVAARRRKE